MTTGFQRLTSLLVGVIAAGAMAVSSPAADAQATYEEAKKEGALIFYSGHPIDRLQKMAEGFKKAYPGIDVDFYRGDARQYAQRFETESATGRHNADVVLATTNRSQEWFDKGFIVPYESPALKDYPPNIRVKGGIATIFGINTTSFAWNTDLVKPEEAPKTWDDLLDPKWKGRIGMLDPLARGGARTWIITMHRELGEEKWLEYMKKLAAQQPKYGRYMQVREMVMSGEIAVHVAAYPDFTEPVKVKGAPVEWGVPEFLVFVGLTTNLSKNAPHPNAGKLFIDYLLSDSAQEILGETGLIPSKSEYRSGGFARLKDAKFVTSALAGDVRSEEYFKDKLRELFGKR